MTTLLEEPQTEPVKVSPHYRLTRQEFIDVIDETLEEMGVHMHKYERDDLRKFALNATKVAFGTWNGNPGCPLQQTGLCTSHYGEDSVFELFVDGYDHRMRNLWGLDEKASGIVTIL